MTPNNCIVIAKFLTNTQHGELKPQWHWELIWGLYGKIQNQVRKKTSNLSVKCMMKFLGLFMVIDPKHPRLIWFKPNLSLNIDIFCPVFQKKNSKNSKKMFSIFFNFFFSIF